MAATQLNSQRATAIGVHVVRAFVALRGMLASNQALANKVNVFINSPMKKPHVAKAGDAACQLGEGREV